MNPYRRTPRQETRSYGEWKCNSCLQHFQVWSDYKVGRCGACWLAEADAWFTAKKGDV